jgi:hypothetical protein
MTGIVGTEKDAIVKNSDLSLNGGQSFVKSTPVASMMPSMKGMNDVTIGGLSVNCTAESVALFDQNNSMIAFGKTDSCCDTGGPTANYQNGRVTHRCLPHQ